MQRKGSSTSELEAGDLSDKSSNHSSAEDCPSFPEVDEKDHPLCPEYQHLADDELQVEFEWTSELDISQSAMFTATTRDSFLLIEVLGLTESSEDEGPSYSPASPKSNSLPLLGSSALQPRGGSCSKPSEGLANNGHQQSLGKAGEAPVYELNLFSLNQRHESVESLKSCGSSPRPRENSCITHNTTTTPAADDTDNVPDWEEKSRITLVHANEAVPDAVKEASDDSTPRPLPQLPVKRGSNPKRRFSSFFSWKRKKHSKPTRYVKATLARMYISHTAKS